jgi:hypothetical protein
MRHVPFLVILKHINEFMGLRTVFFIGLLSVFLIEPACGQGKLVFLNGKEKRFVTAEVKGEYIVYQPEGAKEGVTKRADRFNVFSILKDNGTEEIVYSPDTIDDGDPTIAEVREYIKGENHADSVYKKPMNLISGIGVGLASSAAGFYGIPIPIAYSTVIGQFNPKLPKSEQINNYSEAFVAGYQKKARNKKIKSSLLGGVIGFSVGIASLILILGNE